jgi:hypothetical protein
MPAAGARWQTDPAAASFANGTMILMRFTALPCCHCANRYCIQITSVKSFAKMA